MKGADFESFVRVWREVAPRADSHPVYHELLSRYSEPHRHYHNLAHIADCLAEFDSVRFLAQDPLAVEIAIWFHDVVYDTRAADNEEQSAEIAVQHIAAAGGRLDLCDPVKALILATKSHEALTHPDAPLVVDVDLSIFGRSTRDLWEYEAQIRREYDWVPAATFAAKRAEILERFLSRNKIYRTEPLFVRYESQARDNLRDSIHALRNMTSQSLLPQSGAGGL